MRESFWMRVKARTCRWFGHREVHDKYSVSCGRCFALLRGPLNFTEADRQRRLLPDKTTPEEA